MVVQPSTIGQQSQAVPSLDDTSSDTAPIEAKNNGDENSNSRVPNEDGSVPNEIWVGEPEEYSVKDQGLVKLYVTPKELQWLSLLRDRPDDHERGAIDAWLADILQISSKAEESTCTTGTIHKRSRKSMSCCATPNQTKSDSCCIKEYSYSAVKEDPKRLNGSDCSGVKGSSVVESSCTGAKDDSCIRGSLLSCTGKGDNCCEHIAEFDVMDVQDTLQH
jgi:hypothetical protein